MIFAVGTPGTGTSTAAELLELAQEAGRFGIFEWHARDGWIRLSETFLALHGIDRLDGGYESWLNCVFREDRPRIAHMIENAFAEKRRDIQAEFRVVSTKGRTLRWMEARHLVFYDADGRAERVVGVNVDITERKQAVVQHRAFAETLEEAVRVRTRELEAENEARQRAEEALRQAQKMDAVGQLTGGIAHDFNNLLTVVLGGLDIIGRQLPALGDISAAARISRAREMSLKGVQRAVSLTARLLAFSRQQPLAPRALDVNRLVAESCEFLTRSLGEAVSLETVLAAGLWPAHAYANELENALLNLAVNARDAMPDGGKMTVETANCYLDDAYVAGVAEPLARGQYVLLAVTDTGVGIEKAALERVFDPFFTTKEVGKGTGLGLSQVYGFVRQSSGHVRIYSEVGEGTTVKIYLPRYTGVDVRPAPPKPATGNLASIGAETVLVVEDDAALRAYTVEILGELGYRVLEAANGAAALEILDRGDEIDLLFTDVVMPGGLNGRQLATEAGKRRPNLKMLFTTGYTRNAIVHHGRLDAGVQLISKPFALQELGKRIREVLDAPSQ